MKRERENKKEEIFFNSKLSQGNIYASLVISESLGAQENDFICMYSFVLCSLICFVEFDLLQGKRKLYFSTGGQ